MFCPLIFSKPPFQGDSKADPVGGHFSVGSTNLKLPERAEKSYKPFLIQKEVTDLTGTSCADKAPTKNIWDPWSHVHRLFLADTAVCHCLDSCSVSVFSLALVRSCRSSMTPLCKEEEQSVEHGCKGRLLSRTGSVVISYPSLLSTLQLVSKLPILYISYCFLNIDVLNLSEKTIYLLRTE